MHPFPNLHPFTAWRLKRRVKGGVAAGLTAAEVVRRIGEPLEKRPGEYDAEEIWTYELAVRNGFSYRYSVLFDTRSHVVTASWWAASAIEK